MVIYSRSSVPSPSRVAVSLALGLALAVAPACTPAGGPGAANGSSEVTEDVGQDDLVPLGGLAGCAASSSSLTCRALAAFSAGHMPAPRSVPVSLPGAIAVIPAPGTEDAGQPPVLGGGYLVLGGGGARFQILVPTNDTERDASNALVDAITKGQAPAADNATVVYARSRTETRPAVQIGKSIAWGGASTGFVRETSMGLVVVERSPSVIMVGVFPL